MTTDVDRPRRRRRSTVALGGAMLLGGLAGAGCSDDDDDGRAVAVDDSEPGEVVEVESVDSLAEVLSSLGGPTVDDTDIRYTDSEGVVSVGGLQVAMPILEALDYYINASRNITVPPSWPTLAVLQLSSHDSPAGNPTVGLAVFAQVTLVTDEASRAWLIEDAFVVGLHQDSEVIHESEVTNDESGVSCWAQVRYGSIDEGFDPSHRAVVVFAGPGIAASGVIIWAPGGGYTEIPAVTGGLVESVCGNRPEGL